jgi:hypothetical protein
MMQRNAPKAFGAVLAMSALMSSIAVKAQLVEVPAESNSTVETEAEMRTEQTQPESQALPTTTPPATRLEPTPVLAPARQPVEVTPAMEPSTVTTGTLSTGSRNLAPAATQIAPNLGTPLSVSGANTGIGGSNPGNANTGGVQVQSVNVQANPINEANLMASRADLLRRERLRRELENESRLIEKIEEGRLSDESERARGVDTFSSSLAAQAQAQAQAQALTSAQAQAIAQAQAQSQLQTVPVTAPLSNGATAVAVASTGGSSQIGRFFGETKFQISPFLGYRWLDNDVYEYDTDNDYVTGVGIEGRVNSYVGIEGTFAYGRDTSPLARLLRQ